MSAQGVDPRRVIASGPGGRVVEADVLRFLASQDGAAPAREADAQLAGRRGAELTSMRRSIARATLASARIPQFYLRAEFDASAMLAARRNWLDANSDASVRPSITDFLLKALALGLRDVPESNAIWVDDSIELLDHLHVGLVVNVEGGLLVSVLRDVARFEIVSLARERKRCVQDAQAGRLSGAGASRAASSLSNLGTTRVDDFTALLLPPQSTMLAVGRIAERPLVVDGQLCARPTLRLTLTVDHRVLDGAMGAQLLGRIVRRLEEPASLFDEPTT
jgi:pyruvate dehydrogenase E2 component (dihydrolipoamide acetyltransferase)